MFFALAVLHGDNGSVAGSAIVAVGENAVVLCLSFCEQFHAGGQFLEKEWGLRITVVMFVPFHFLAILQCIRQLSLVMPLLHELFHAGE